MSKRMKFTAVLAVVLASNLVCAFAGDASESTKQSARVVARSAAPAAPKKLQATRRMLIERMKRLENICASRYRTTSKDGDADGRG